MRAKNVFAVITNSALDAALFISILAQIIKVGTIIKPPPTPNRPLKKPTKIPNKINKGFKFDLTSIEYFLNREIPEKKITIENNTIKKECFEIFKK